MEEKLSVKRLTIRHYKNKDLYNQYDNVRKDSDINIIGDSMTVYGTSVVDEEINSLKENISTNDQNIRKLVNDSISSCNNNITTLQNNTYSKLEIDNKDEAIKKDVSEQISQVVTQIPNSLPANGGNADTAKRLLTAKTIELAGKAFSYAESFDGSKNITINVNRVTDAEKLTNSRQITLSGDVSGSAYFDGSSNMSINVVVNHSAKANGAKRAASALRADSADTAARLLTERAITLSGDVSGSGTFDGSQALEIVTTLAKQGGVVDGNVSNPDAWWVKLGGKFPLIIQGIHNKWVDSTKRQSCTFPIRFPNACLMAQNTIEYFEGSGDANMDTVYQVTQTGMDFRCDTKCGIYLLMIGY